MEPRSDGVIIVGTWSPTQGPLSAIEGDVTVLGGGNRLRGVRVTGRLTSNANNFSAAFCDVASATITGNGVSLLRNRFSAGQATVPSANAVLVDNTGTPRCAGSRSSWERCGCPRTARCPWLSSLGWLHAKEVKLGR